MQLGRINRWRSFTLAPFIAFEMQFGTLARDKWKFMKGADRWLSLKNGDISWSIDHKKEIRRDVEDSRVQLTFIYNASISFTNVTAVRAVASSNDAECY